MSEEEHVTKLYRLVLPRSINQWLPVFARMRQEFKRSWVTLKQLQEEYARCNVQAKRWTCLSIKFHHSAQCVMRSMRKNHLAGQNVPRVASVTEKITDAQIFVPIQTRVRIKYPDRDDPRPTPATTCVGSLVESNYTCAGATDPRLKARCYRWRGGF